VKTIASNCLVILGSGCIVYGVSLLHPALGYITGGALALVAGVNLSRGK
jgi:hypothetical protein